MHDWFKTLTLESLKDEYFKHNRQSFSFLFIYLI